MAIPRSPRTKEEVVKDFRTAEILVATRTVVAEIGYPGASMERIAQEAGISKGTIYLYFKNKETLLAATFRDSFERFLDEVQTATHAAGTCDDKIRAVARTAFEHTEANLAFYSALQEARPELGRTAASSEAGEEVFKEIDRFEQLVTGLIEQGFAAGVYREVDAGRCARFLTHLIRGSTTDVIIEGSSVMRENEVDEMVDFYLHGLRKAP